MKVPVREIELTPTPLNDGKTEINPPVRVYDTAGPYSDPFAKIDVYKGLDAIREPWISGRSDLDTVETPYRGKNPQLIPSLMKRKALRGKDNVTQMHFAEGRDHA